MKKVTKKQIKSVAVSAVKKTEGLIKKAGKEAGVVAKIIQKKWKDSEPQRAKYKAEIKVAAKKAGKEAGVIAKDIQKKWKDSEPQRAKYKEEVKVAASKAGAKGVELLKSGLKNSIKIGGDVADVIKKDIREMRETGFKNRDVK